MNHLLVQALDETLADWSTAADVVADQIWKPLPATEGRGYVVDGRHYSPQEFALDSLADELFFGGAGGGGKSDLIIGAAVTRHRRAIIFRRELKQITGAEGLWERAKEIVGAHGRPNDSTKIIRGITGGRVVEFAGVEQEKDKDKYKGRPHDLKCFDEIPEFTKTQYRFLITWLRTSVLGQRTRVIVTGNPPTTAEGEWVVKYWGPWLDKRHAHPAKDGELRWYTTINGEDVEQASGAAIWLTERADAVYVGECAHDRHVATNRCLRCRALHVKPRSRTFIRANVEDNPHYMATGYDQVLNSLPEPLRSQMRFGDFAAAQTDNPWQVIPSAWVKAAQERSKTFRPRDDATLTSVGCDPSRGGEDKFCIALFFGSYVAPVIKHPGIAAPDGKTGAALIFKAIDGDRDVPVGIDVIGSAGSSVYDSALDLNLSAIALNGSEGTDAREASGALGFKNKRAAFIWAMREALDPKNNIVHPMVLPDDPELFADLTSMRWKPTPQGIQVESKEDIKKRIGRSPDTGEAVIYGNAQAIGDGLGMLAFIKRRAEAMTRAGAQAALESNTADGVRMQVDDAETAGTEHASPDGENEFFALLPEHLRPRKDERT